MSYHTFVVFLNDEMVAVVSARSKEQALSRANQDPVLSQMLEDGRQFVARRLDPGRLWVKT